MIFKFLVVTLLLWTSIRGQNDLLGSVKRVNISVCKNLLTQIVIPYADTLANADMASCDVQVVAGVIYRMWFFNLTQDVPKCYFEVWRKSASSTIVNDKVMLDFNCALLLTSVQVAAMPVEITNPVAKSETNIDFITNDSQN